MCVHTAYLLMPEGVWAKEAATQYGFVTSRPYWDDTTTGAALSNSSRYNWIPMKSHTICTVEPTHWPINIGLVFITRITA